MRLQRFGLALILSLSLAACGGGGGGNPTPTPGTAGADSGYPVQASQTQGADLPPGYPVMPEVTPPGPYPSATP